MTFALGSNPTYVSPRPIPDLEEVFPPLLEDEDEVYPPLPDNSLKDYLPILPDECDSDDNTVAASIWNLAYEAHCSASSVGSLQANALVSSLA